MRLLFKPEAADGKAIDLPQPLSLTAFYYFMVESYPSNFWLRAGHADSQSAVISESGFRKRFQRLFDMEISLVDIANLSLPLQYFYNQVAINYAEDHRVSSRALFNFTSVKESMVQRLPGQLLITPVVLSSFDDDDIQKMVDSDSWRVTYISDETRRWWARAANGDSELFRKTLTLFLMKHGDMIKASGKSFGRREILDSAAIEELNPLYSRALLLARICITYGDYSFAKTLSEPVSLATESVALVDNDLEAIKLHFSASRILADAKNFLFFRQSRSDINEHFDVQRQSLAFLRSKLKQKASLLLDEIERDMLAVRLRALCRHKLLRYAWDEEFNSEDCADVERLRALVKSFSVLPRSQSSNRFVHLDTICRAEALLTPDGADGAERRSNELDLSQFQDDDLDRDILDTPNLRALINKHRLFRSCVTKAIIQIAFVLKSSDSKEINLRLNLAEQSLNAIEGAISPELMFHTRLEVELLRSSLKSLRHP